MAAGLAIQLDFGGAETLYRTLGVIEDALSADDLALAAEGFIRETAAPGGVGPIVERGYTLTGSIEDAFAREGVTDYRSSPWEGYGREPSYARYKEREGGGTQIGVWAGSTGPLAKTFVDPGDPDHVEEIRATSTSVEWEFGSSREYAWTFARGLVIQPWDFIIQPGRDPIPPQELAGFRYAKGIQRVLVGRLIELGQSPGEALRYLRVEP